MLGPLLLLSLVGLAVGPLLAAFGRGRAVVGAAIDGLTLGVIPALILTRLLPHAFEELGGLAISFAAVGFALISLGHRRGHAAEERLGRAVVLPTLALHALADGAGLALSVSAGHGDDSGLLLGAALVLHRLPEGLFIARAFGSDGGDRRTALRRLAWPFVVLSLATAIGAWSGRALLELVPEALLDGVVAFGLGAMLRMILHVHEPHPETSRAARVSSGAAFVAGIALALAIPAPDSVLTRARPRELSIVQSLGPLFVETAPAILGGLFVACVVRACSRRRIRTRHGDVFALLPAVGLSLRLLGLRLTLAWVVVAALFARVVPSDEPVRASSFGHRAREALREGFGAALDRVGARFLIGLLAAVACEAFVEPSALARLDSPLDVVLAAVAMTALHVHLLVAAPFAAVLVHKGLSVGAALAILVVGPTTTTGILGVLRRRAGLRHAANFLAVILLVAIGLGLLANRLVDPRSLPEIHRLVAHDHHALEWAAAVILALLLFASTSRLGARGWVASLTGEGAGDHEHRHGHDPGEAHASDEEERRGLAHGP